MTSPYEPMLADALATYRRRREDLAALQHKLAAVSGTATAPRKVVSATVGRQGELTELSFPTAAYKNLTPTELAAVIVKTVNEARAAAIRQSAGLLAPMMPAGLAADAVLAGTADLTAFLPAEPRVATEETTA